jgi:hypothetical protein
MLHKIFKGIMLLGITLCTVQIAFAQECANNNNNNNAAITTQLANDLFFNNSNQTYFHDGTVTLNNTTTINGRFSLNYYKDDTYSVIHIEDGERHYISTDSITSVTLFRKEKNDIIDKTLFVKAKDDSKLYRMISDETYPVKLFDSATKPFSGLLIGDVFVQENDSITHTYNFWSSGPKQDVINYINKRDNTNYKRRDFKTINDLVVQLND